MEKLYSLESELKLIKVKIKCAAATTGDLWILRDAADSELRKREEMLNAKENMFRCFNFGNSSNASHGPQSGCQGSKGV